MFDVDLVGEEGAEGAGEGRGDAIGETPALEGRLDPRLFLECVVTGGCG